MWWSENEAYYSRNKLKAKYISYLKWFSVCVAMKQEAGLAFADWTNPAKGALSKDKLLHVVIQVTLKKPKPTESIMQSSKYVIFPIQMIPASSNYY